MASSDTLSLFVPNPGDTITQTTTSGARVFTSQTSEDINSRVFPNQGRTISDVGIKEPTAGDTRTTFSGASKDISYTGNSDDNTVSFTGNTRNTRVSTGDGDDNLIASDISRGTISLGDGDNAAYVDSISNSSITSGGGDDTVFISERVNSLRISTGGGDDTLVFGGQVNGSTIFLGKGEDVLDFSARVQNTWIDLGNDTDVDQVSFFSKGDIGGGTAIFGAGEGDLLIIGGEEYIFDSNESAFISSQGDSITFG